MAGQRGSVLAGTLALSLVIATGAAGVLVLAGIWNSGNASRSDRTRLLRAAEAGAQVGARWMRQSISDADYAAHVGVTPISNGVIGLEGARVRVAWSLDAGSQYLVSEAELSPCKERVVITWRINTFTGSGPAAITFGEWNETIQTCAF